MVRSFTAISQSLISIIILISFSIAVIKHSFQNQLGEECLFGLQVSITVLQGKSRQQLRNLEAEDEAETMEECSSLVCSLWLVLSLLLWNTGPPVQGWHHPPHPTSISNQKNASETCRQASLIEEIPVEVLSSQACQLDNWNYPAQLANTFLRKKLQTRKECDNNILSSKGYCRKLFLIS